MKLTSEDKENNVILVLRDQLSYHDIATRLNIDLQQLMTLPKEMNANANA